MTSTKNKSKTFIIIPAHNEARNLPTVLTNVLKLNYSAVVVDDGSTDSTAQVVKRFPVTILRHATNLGYYETLKTGIQFALSQKAKYLVFFDADGQHPVEDISKLLKTLSNSHSDLVIGSRFIEPHKSYSSTKLVKMIAKLFSLNCRLLTGRYLTDTTSGFQALTSSTAEFLFQNYLSVDFPVGNLILLLHSNFKITEVSISMKPRQQGKSMHDSLGYIMFVPPQMIIANLVILFKIIFSLSRYPRQER